VRGLFTFVNSRPATPPVHSGKALTNILERPKEIRLNIFYLDKRAAEIQTKEQDKFLDAMGEIFKHSGLGGRKS